jgi:hypothetical protein
MKHRLVASRNPAESVGGPQHAQRALPWCFAPGAPCPRCASYADGRWLPTSREAAYRLEHTLWRQMNVMRMPGNSNHHWGLCEDIAYGPSGPAFAYGPTRLERRTRNVARRRYEWMPRRCSLARFDRRKACRALHGQQVLVAGDSATAQFFLSLALQLGGPAALGKNRRGGSAVLKDVTASACEDAVRLNFVRNDLLLWTSQVAELRELGKQCTSGRALLQPFANRVRDADLLILGTGHHYPHVPPHDGEESRGSVFVQSLNHSLAQVLAVRGAAGHAPDSVVLLGSPFPVAGCSRFSAPITPTQALTTNSSLNKWSGHWQQTAGFSQLAQLVAAEKGVHFVDVAPLSIQRPDDTLARWCRLSGLDCYNREAQQRKELQQRKEARRTGRRDAAAPPARASAPIVVDADYREEDCLHTCLPGPVDEYVRLLYNLLRARAAPGRANASAALQPRGTTSGGERRFFAQNRSAWLYTTGAESLEPCGDASSPQCAFLSPEQGLTHCAPWTGYPPSVANRAFLRSGPSTSVRVAKAKRAGPYARRVA